MFVPEKPPEPMTKKEKIIFVAVTIVVLIICGSVIYTVGYAAAMVKLPDCKTITNDTYHLSKENISWCEFNESVGKYTINRSIWSNALT